MRTRAAAAAAFSENRGGGQQNNEPVEAPAGSPQARFVCFVRTPDNKNIAVEAEPSTTVEAVVEQALGRSSCKRLCVYQVYVQAGGHHLEMQATLEQAGVGALSTLRVTPNPAAIRGPANQEAHVQSPQTRFVCFVRTPDNKNIAVEAEPSTSVGAVVEQALGRSSCKRLRVDQVYVQAAGHHLELASTLGSAGVGALSTLRVTPNPAAIRCQPVLTDIAEEFRALRHKTEDIDSSQKQAMVSRLSMAAAPLHASKPCLPTIKELVNSGLLKELRKLYLHPRLPTVAKECALHGLQLCAEGLHKQYLQALQEQHRPPEPACLCFDALLGMLVPVAMSSRRGSVWAASMITKVAGNLDVVTGLPRLSDHGQGADGKAARERLLGCLATHTASLLDSAVASFSDVFAALPRMEWTRQDPLPWERVCGAAEDLFSLVKALQEGSIPTSIPRDAAWEAKRCKLFSPVYNSLTRQCGKLKTAIDHTMAAALLPNGGQHPEGRAQQFISEAAPWLDRMLTLRIAAWTATFAYASQRKLPVIMAIATDILDAHTHYQQVAPALVSFSRSAFSSFLDQLGAGIRLTYLREHAAAHSVLGSDAEEDEDEPTIIYVSREEVLETSYAELLPLRPWQLTRELLVCYRGEPGYGAGVTREWLGQLLLQLLSPALGLFARCGSNAKAIFPSPTASVQPQHLQYLRVAGRAMGLALLHGVPLRCHLAAAFHSGLGGPGHPCDDMEQLLEVDPQLWRSLQAILETEDAGSLGLTFTLPCDHLGQSVEVPLAEDPSEAVTNANRLHYVQSAAKHLLRTRVHAEVAAVRQGLEDVLKMCPTQLFSCQAFNSLVEGAPGSLSTQQWRQHTRCSGWEGWRGPEQQQQDGMEVDRASPDGVAEPEVLRWLWLLVGEMREEQRCALLRFWTSLACLPEGGFGALPQQLRIVRADPASQPLPVARTCFYELLLPAYSDILTLAGGLKEAIAHAEGFGMA